jgi:hypothetical protein
LFSRGRVIGHANRKTFTLASSVLVPAGEEIPMTASFRPSRTVFLSLIVVAGALGAALVAQATAREQPQPPSQRPAMMGQSQMSGMMAERQKMMAEMQASQKKLDELVAKMNSATGSDKVDQIAAVVNELVAQHKRMSHGMMSMEGGMMEQMLRMHRGAAPPGSQSAEQPPDHDRHHPER